MAGLMFDYICDKQVNVNAYMAAKKKKKKNTTMKSLLLLI